MVGRTLAAAALALSLGACSSPVFVPEAGPGAPGYKRRSLPPPPRVELLGPDEVKPASAGGAIDSVAPEGNMIEITGWAPLDPQAPRGVVRVVLPDGVEARVEDAGSLARPDVVDATGDASLIWAGFSVLLSGDLPDDLAVCVVSRSTKGTFVLGGSDPGLCPA